MFVNFNPNPREKLVGDCTVRAVAIAEDILWEEAFLSLAMLGYLEGDMPSSNEVVEKYLVANGYEKQIINNTCPNCYTIKDFCNDHEEGVFVVGTGTHFVAVIDGDYYDTWDSGDKIPIYCFMRKDGTNDDELLSTATK